MIKRIHMLMLGVLFAVVCFSAAQAEDCSRFQNSVAAYRDAAASLQQAQASFDSKASGSRDQERHALCRAVKDTAFSVIVLKLETIASCLADPSKYQETVDGMADVLKTLANLQGSTCDAGE